LIKEEERLRKTNIEGTANIVNFVSLLEYKKLCFVSSIATLGDLPPHEKFITEETEWNPELPHNDYAISKYGNGSVARTTRRFNHYHQSWCYWSCNCAYGLGKGVANFYKS
jgi:thioester reductase-like protein